MLGDIFRPYPLTKSHSVFQAPEYAHWVNDFGVWFALGSLLVKINESSPVWCEMSHRVIVQIQAVCHVQVDCVVRIGLQWFNSYAEILVHQTTFGYACNSCSSKFWTMCKSSFLNQCPLEKEAKWAGWILPERWVQWAESLEHFYCFVLRPGKCNRCLLHLLHLLFKLFCGFQNRSLLCLSAFENDLGTQF